MNCRVGQDEPFVGWILWREQRSYVNTLRDSDVEKWALVDWVGTKVDSTHKRRHRAAWTKLRHTGGCQPSHVNFVHPPDWKTRGSSQWYFHNWYPFSVLHANGRPCGPTTMYICCFFGRNRMVFKAKDKSWARLFTAPLYRWHGGHVAGANQPVHWFLGGKGLGIQQGMSVWVGSPKSWSCVPTQDLYFHT